MRYILFAASLAAVFALANVSYAGPLYANNFEVDDTANWTVNVGPADEAANFFFDYVTLAGIPSATNSAVGDKYGMKLQANLSSNTFGGFSVSPTGEDFGSVYKLKFDWWSNSVGPFPVGGSGSTNLSTYGVGTAGTTVQWQGSAWDSVWFAASTDGGTANDYRAYSNNSGAAPGGIWPETSGAYAAGNVAGVTGNLHAYYSGFGSETAPPAQLALFPGQTGTTAVGTGMWAWHEVVIDKTSTEVTWTVDGLLMATVPLAGAPGAGGPIVLGGGNIFFGHADINGGSSADANDAALLFTLIDNVVVIPEPSTLMLCLVAALGGLARRRRR